MSEFQLEKINEGICALYDGAGLHVGNFKWIGGEWKFKAVGYGPSGQVLPGAGPFTDRHNSRFAQLDSALIQAHFLQE